MKKRNIFVFLIVTMLLLSACGDGSVESHKEEKGDAQMQKNIAIQQTGMTNPVPEEYKSTASKQGKVEKLTYDSRDYARDGAAIAKTAYVYTPFGYDENDNETNYNIIYLMHGWGGHAGEYFDYTSTKNMFDHLIENEDIPPVIIISATFYNENSSTDFGSSENEFLRQ